MHVSKVLSNIDEKLKPNDKIACIGCIHAGWHTIKNRGAIAGDREWSLENYCGSFYAIKYSTLDTPPSEVYSCDRFSDTPPPTGKE